MSNWGIVEYKDELMIKINDDFPMEDEVDGIVITLKKDMAKRFANDILKELENKKEK